MIDLLIVLLVSIFLVRFRDEGKIPVFSELRENNVFVTGKISSDFKELVAILDPETQESLLITGTAESLPKTFLIRDGKVINLVGN